MNDSFQKKTTIKALGGTQGRGRRRRQREELAQISGILGEFFNLWLATSELLIPAPSPSPNPQQGSISYIKYQPHTFAICTARKTWFMNMSTLAD